jgi:hypothetical protein
MDANLADSKVQQLEDEFQSLLENVIRYRLQAMNIDPSIADTPQADRLKASIASAQSLLSELQR